MVETIVEEVKAAANEPMPSPFERRKWRFELDRVVNNPKFKEFSQETSHYLHEKLIGQGESMRQIADLLHGKVLGHPLHPLLTDITIGSWTLGFIYDVLALLPGTTQVRRAADSLTIIGLLTAVPTAISGMVDYASIKQNAASYGAAHGLLNSVAILCYSRSVLARLSGNRGRSFFYALLGFGVIVLSSWLGGDLVYRHRVGVNHVPESKLDDWSALMSLAELEEGVPTKVDVADVAVLLYRQGEEVYAINAVCSHAGGSLEDGQVVDDYCIECPWHQSVFDMRDGHVVHSPATVKQPQYEVRIRDEQIEVRSTPQTQNEN